MPYQRDSGIASLDACIDDCNEDDDCNAVTYLPQMKLCQRFNEVTETSNDSAQVKSKF